jgi:hypothetical protein
MEITLKLDGRMDELLTSVVDDLPTQNINLYELLDNDEFKGNLVYDKDEQIELEDFIYSIIAYLDINYPNTIYTHLFTSIVIDVFGYSESWDSLTRDEFEVKKRILFEGLKDITYQTLSQGHIDYDMIYTMLEKKVEL